MWGTNLIQASHQICFHNTDKFFITKFTIIWKIVFRFLRITVATNFQRVIKEDEMGWDGMGWDGMGWDGMRWDEMGWDEMGWDEMRFLSDEGPMLETLDHTIRIGSTPTFLYFDLRWDEMRWDEIRSDEMRWDQIRSDEN